MKIKIGCDHAGYELKERVIERLKASGYDVSDAGAHGIESVDYPYYAGQVAKAVASGEVERGILICGSGIGMCMAANRVRGARAVQAAEPFSARMSRRHNNSNILCLGSRFIGVDMAMEILDVWLKEPFDGGRHERRVELIDQLPQT
ncbi:MAG: ribose 5-phosphate isomerase B [Syntrophobacteraceae bacterium]